MPGERCPTRRGYGPRLRAGTFLNSLESAGTESGYQKLLTVHPESPATAEEEFLPLPSPSMDRCLAYVGAVLVMQPISEHRSSDPGRGRQSDATTAHLRWASD